MYKKFTKEEFIELARKVHGDKYDYSKVEYVDSKHDVMIICPKHGEFWQRANRHLQGCGCRKCASEQRAISQKFSTEEWIEKARKIHGDKYDYSKVEYKNNYTKVCIICPQHGEFYILPYAHINLKEGCSKCANKYSPTTEEWIKQAEEIHGKEYDYSKVDLNNRDEKGRICIICPKHGEFWQRPDSHLNGCKCKKCVDDEKKKKYSLSLAEFIKKAKKVHGDKYDYSKVEYKNNYTKVCIICPQHGEFWQTPSGHLYNFQGCPHCKKSRMEEYTRLILERSNIQFEIEKTFDWLIYDKNMKLDFLCNKIAIECQGGQHFIPVKKYGGEDGLRLRINRDKLKYTQCKDNGINIIYIIPTRYKNTDVFKEFYSDKNYIFFKNIDDELIKRLREVL